MEKFFEAPELVKANKVTVVEKQETPSPAKRVDTDELDVESGSPIALTDKEEEEAKDKASEETFKVSIETKSELEQTEESKE